MKSTADLEPRRLGPSDRSALESFVCSTGAFREPFVTAVEETIHEVLPDLVDAGTVESLSLWDGEGLVALVVWSAHPAQPVWHIAILATRLGRYRRQGCAERLKLKVLDRAWEADIQLVTSNVHFDNHAMGELNSKLGARMDAVEGDHQLHSIRRPT